MAAGEDYDRLYGYRHDTMRVVAEYQQRVMTLSVVADAMASLSQLERFHIGSPEEREAKVNHLIVQATTPGRSPDKGEAKAFWQGCRSMTKDEVRQILRIAHAWLRAVDQSVMQHVRSHVDLPLPQDFTPEALVDWAEANAPLLLVDKDFPSDLKSVVKKVLCRLVDEAAQESLRATALTEQSATFPFRRDLIAQELKGGWGIIGLFCLAAVTFPHESYPRYPYPAPSGAPLTPLEAARSDKPLLGTDHYRLGQRAPLGIVARIGELLELATQLLRHVGSYLPTIAATAALDHAHLADLGAAVASDTRNG